MSIRELIESLLCETNIDEEVTASHILKAYGIPDRKGGEWIKNELNGAWHCSECGENNYYAYCWSSEKGEYELQDRYCPSCGAKMKGEGDE